MDNIYDNFDLFCPDYYQKYSDTIKSQTEFFAIRDPKLLETEIYYMFHQALVPNINFQGSFGINFKKYANTEQYKVPADRKNQINSHYLLTDLTDITTFNFIKTLEQPWVPPGTDIYAYRFRYIFPVEINVDLFTLNGVVKTIHGLLRNFIIIYNTGYIYNGGSNICLHFLVSNGAVNKYNNSNSTLDQSLKRGKVQDINQSIKYFLSTGIINNDYHW